MTRRRTADRGFTLIETLVALVVLGLVMVAVTQGVQFGLRALQLQTRAVAQGGDLDALDRTLRGLITRIAPNGFSEQGNLVGNATSVAFTSELPASLELAAPNTRRVEVSVAVDGAHRLELSWRPHYRQPIGPPPPATRETLLEGVDHLEVSYWQPGGAWVTAWTSRLLPRLIRIRVVFPPGSRRVTPDIVAAPMRDPWRA